MAERYVSQKEFEDQILRLRAEKIVLFIAIDTLLDKLAPTEKVRQSIKVAMEQAAIDPTRVPSFIRERVDEALTDLLGR